MKAHILHYRLGKEAPLGFTLFGVLVVIIGIGFFLNGLPAEFYAINTWAEVIGILVSLIGLTFVLSYSGVMLDPKTRKIKVYTSILFLKAGRWESLDEFKDVIVLRKKRVFGFGTHGDHGATTHTSQVDFEVYFADKNHFDKVLICRRRDKEKAYQEAREIADEMNCEFVSFNPGRRFQRKLL